MYDKKSILEVLTKARDSIRDPQHWCRRDYALNNDGIPVPPQGKDVHARCAVGAIVFAAGGFGDLHSLTCETLRRSIDKNCPFYYIESFNDHMTHPQILDLFDRTIATLNQEVAPI